MSKRREPHLGSDLYDRPEATLEELGYSGVVEETYTGQHPQVLEWTDRFLARFRSRRIFERFEEVSGADDAPKAVAVGTQWHRFSQFVPWLLCRAASQVSDNRRRHYVIQTAFEELGMRKESEIHAEMFQATTLLVGLTRTDHLRLSNVAGVAASLRYLQNCLIRSSSDAYVLGLLLGLECPARENIETVFGSLAVDPEKEKLLAQSHFFILHRCLELEHIRLTVSNFLRFCPSKGEKAAFVRGFDAGIEFWSRFWRETGKLVLRERKGRP